MRISDWSSDVCSSDLPAFNRLIQRVFRARGAAQHGQARAKTTKAHQRGLCDELAAIGLHTSIKGDLDFGRNGAERDGFAVLVPVADQQFHCLRTVFGHGVGSGTSSCTRSLGMSE